MDKLVFNSCPILPLRTRGTHQKNEMTRQMFESAVVACCMVKAIKFESIFEPVRSIREQWQSGHFSILCGEGEGRVAIMAMMMMMMERIRRDKDLLSWNMNWIGKKLAAFERNKDDFSSIKFISGNLLKSRNFFTQGLLSRKIVRVNY